MIRMSEEVATAIAEGRPVVALESSVIAQGLPPPHNLENARACEEAIRAAGAVPATTAVIDGVPRAGVTAAELERLASEQALLKVASRDLAIAMATNGTGGTTVSATCEIASRAGIRVFATGGLGGVHRRFAEDLDVSQDLAALARFNVAVVCAGAKSVLDLPKTLEALEALGVPVVGIGSRDFPAFYARTSGLVLEHSVPGADGAAAIAHARFDLLAQPGGIVFALPPPAETAIDGAEVDAWVDAALADAQARGITGKAVTPFLLANVAQRSGGRSLAANLALLRNNARFAGELAVSYARRVRAG